MKRADLDAADDRDQQSTLSRDGEPDVHPFAAAILRRRAIALRFDVGEAETRVANHGLGERLDQKVVDARLDAEVDLEPLLLGEQPRRIDLALERELRNLLALRHAPGDRPTYRVQRLELLADRCDSGIRVGGGAVH